MDNFEKDSSNYKKTPQFMKNMKNMIEKNRVAFHLIQCKLRNSQIKILHFQQSVIKKLIKQKHKVEQILMDGRLYSLHNQIIKWKEVKLLLDYDKKIEQFANQKVEKLKSLSTQFKSIKFIVETNSYITKQFQNYLQNNRSELEQKLFCFLQFSQESETLQQGSKIFKQQQMIEKIDLLFSEIQELIRDDEYFSKIEKIQSNLFKQEIKIYFDKKIIPDFLLQINQSQILLDFSIHQFKQFYKFPQLDSSGFYQDPTEIVNQIQNKNE